MMKTIKSILGAMLVLVLLSLSLGMFLEDNYGVERSITIDAPAAKIFPQVNNLKNWPNWSPWAAMDPSMKVVYSSDTPVGAGAWYSWESENSNVGTGKLSIVKSETNQKITTELFFGPDPSNPGIGQWVFEPSGAGTKVTWSMNGTASNYFERYFSILMDAMVGSSFEEGLMNLKRISES